MARSSLAIGLLFMALVGQCYGQLKVGFYNKKCGKVDIEEVVFLIVKKHFVGDKDTVADLVRLQFHDCVIRGCDASILLEGKNTEKTASPNQSVRGFDIVEECKVALDKRCPGVVSCADIIVLAARAATFLGGANWYNVETGRKDGRTSIAKEAAMGLPGPSIPIPVAIQVFRQLGLSAEDFVVLLGCHSVGTAHCVHFQDRLYNFRGTKRSDPNMARSLLATLKKKCPRGSNSNNEAFLDQTRGSEFKMDNAFYKRLLEKKGILEIDNAMGLHPATRGIVKKLASDKKLFLAKIGPAMRKLAKFNVKVHGEVRLGTCKKVRH